MHRTFSSLSKGKIFYLPALIFTAIFSVFMLVERQMPVTAAQETDETQTSSKKARPDMLAVALDLGAAATRSVFAAKGIENNDSTLAGEIVDGLRDKESGEREREDLLKSFAAANQLPCAEEHAEKLRGGRFAPGVYCAKAADLDGEIVFDAGEDSHGFFVFRVAETLAAEKSVQMNFANGARPENVFFIVGDTVEIGADTNFSGNIIARNSIAAEKGSIITGKIFSLDGAVKLNESRVSASAAGTLQICKQQRGTGLEDRIFRFQIGAEIYTARVGQCSAPITLPTGNYVIEELLTGNLAPSGTFNGRFMLVDVNSPTSGALRTVNLPLRRATVFVDAGSSGDQVTTVNFVNTFAVSAAIEICKKPAPGSAAVNDQDVSGFFDYTVDAIPNTTFTIPAGQCSGPISVLVPTTPPPPLPNPAFVRVTEIAERGFTLESVTTFPAARLQSVTLGKGIAQNGTTEYDNPGGGYVQAYVLEGDANNQTSFTFYNRTNPAPLRVCKVAGAGIPVGTRFRFTVMGLAPSSATAALPGTAVSTTLDVVAGDAAQGGGCLTIDNPFIVGSNVTVTEQPEPVDPIANVPAGGVIVTNIKLNSSVATAPTAISLSNRTITFPVRANGATVEFTNAVAEPTSLKICKIAAGGIAFGTPFTFDVAIENDPNLVISPVTVTAGPASQGGYCVYAQGPFPPTGGLTAPLGTFRTGLTASVTERAVTGVGIVAITSPTGTPTVNLSLRRGSLLLRFPAGFNEITFSNSGGGCPNGCGPQLPRLFDFDGDAISDISIFGSGGNWSWIRTSDGVRETRYFGLTTDKIVPADYDGDGKTDTAVYRSGNWYWIDSRNGVFHSEQFGTAEDVPVPSDYDGDGKADLGVYRPSVGTWYVQKSRDGFAAVRFGLSTDKPVSGDYDGDGKTDIAVYRPSNGTWYVQKSLDGFYALQFGVATDKVVPGDYDGDGKTDIAVYRSGSWYLMRSRDGFTGVAFGSASDTPVPADYDGDRKSDLAVYRDGFWNIRRSSDNVVSAVNFGAAGDIPVPSAYVR